MQYWENLRKFIIGRKYDINDPLDYSEIPLVRDNGDIQKILDNSSWVKYDSDVDIDSKIMFACLETKAKVITKINEKSFVKNEHKVWCSRVNDVEIDIDRNWPTSKECEHIKDQIQIAMRTIGFKCGLDSSIESVNYESMCLADKHYCKIYANDRTNKYAISKRKLEFDNEWLPDHEHYSTSKKNKEE